MKKILYIICMCLVALSCERRELTYGFDPTVAIMVNVDWSGMDKLPTGMSVYCFPRSGEAPTIAFANIGSVQSSIRVNLAAGVYDVLVFNQIPSDFGSVRFVGMKHFATAEIQAAPTTSKWAVSKAPSDLVVDPAEVAAATSLDFEITEDAIREHLELTTKGGSDIDPNKVIYKTIEVAPQVVVKTSRIKIRLSGINNYRSARATLYGMATGYNFSTQKSRSDKVTHILEEWTSRTYEGEYSEGEVIAYHTSFGLPEQTTETRASDYSDWDGEMKVDYLLVDNKTKVSKTYDLGGRLTLAEDMTAGRADGDEDLDRAADIYINLDYEDSDTPMTLPDVKPVDGAGSGFDAVIDDWDNEEIFDVPIN